MNGRGDGQARHEQGWHLPRIARGLTDTRIGAFRRIAATLAASLTLVAVLATVGAAPAQAEPQPLGPSGPWENKLNEEFSSNGLNESLWTPYWYQGAMSGQCTAKNLVSQPGNGYLYLEVRAQASECSGIHNSDTGALVESDPGDGVSGHTGFKYSYGYVEWRAYVLGKTPSGWTCPSKGGCMADWPALWSFPENKETEIDTMEGLRTAEHKGETCFHFHRHEPKPETEWGECPSAGYAGAWHTFGVLWEKEKLTWYYDGVNVGNPYFSSEIKSTPQYLIMDLVPEGSHGGPLLVPDEMTVDYVRVWQHPKPTVTTSPASEETATTAKLNGYVNPNGLDTQYYFEYGPTQTYGSKIPAEPEDIGNGTNPIYTWNKVEGLSPNTTYHFRVCGTSSSGTSCGEDRSFLTRALPPSAAFQTNTGNLAIYSSASESSKITVSGVAGGTSPSIAALPGGGYDAAFQTNTGNLAIYSSASESSKITVSGVAGGTSPSIAALPGGGYDAAFQTNTGNLAIYSSASESSKITVSGVAGGTSPSIAALPGGGYDAAFQTNTGNLAIYSSASESSKITVSGVAGGTSPSIAALPGGGYDAAFQTNTGNLAIYSSASESSKTTVSGVAGGTSPSIAALPGGGYDAAFQTNTGNLAIYSSASESSKITVSGVAGGTSPGIGEE